MNGILSGVEIYSFSNGQKLSIHLKQPPSCKEEYRLFAENSKLARSMSKRVTHPFNSFQRVVYVVQG